MDLPMLNLGAAFTRELWRRATRIGAIPRLLIIDQQGILRADLGSPPRGHLERELKRLFE